MNLKSQFDMWMKDADAKMSRYIRGQQDAMIAQKKLTAAQAELTNFTTGQSKKTQNVLVSLCGGQSKALVGITFNGWEHAWRQEKLEREVRKEYEVRLERSEKALAEYKAEQLKNAWGPWPVPVLLSRLWLPRGAARIRRPSSEVYVFWAPPLEHLERVQEVSATAYENEGAKVIQPMNKLFDPW